MKRNQAEQREFTLRRCTERGVPFPIWPEDVAVAADLITRLPRVDRVPDGWEYLTGIPNSPEAAFLLVPGFGYAVMPGGVTIGQFRRIPT